MRNGNRLSGVKTASSSSLAEKIGAAGRDGRIRLMTHQILGYPSFEANYEMIRLFHEQGIGLVELQLPFSEPIADGPVFLRANQAALASGVTIGQCLAFAGRVAAEFGSISFLFMTYYNIVLQYGTATFVRKCAELGIRGLIVPDAYPEESTEFLEACGENGVEPILIATPYTSDGRLAYLAGLTGGFLYCAARKGVTGAKTAFGGGTDEFLARVRRHARTPVAVGFGIQSAEDVAYLQGKCDIAIIGTQLLQLLERDGLPGVAGFLAELRTITG